MKGKKASPAQKKARGTSQPCRDVTVMFPDHASRPDPEIIDPPKWVPAAAKRVFREKVETYRMRGQKVNGFQDALGHYCCLEVEIRKMWKMGMPPNGVLLGRLNDFTKAFYDTPISQNVVIGTSEKKSNKFSGRGKR